jgi:hypothetical protein
MTKKLYYLASPYSHKDPAIKKRRAEMVTESAVDLLHLGIFVFAPISYNEPWEKYNLPGDWNFWQDFDKTFVSRCDGGIIVLMLDGWDKSVGVTAEIEFAKSIGLPVYYTTPEQIKNGDLSFIHNLNNNKTQSALFCCGQKF